MEREPQGQMTTEAPSVGLNPEAQAAGGKMIEQAGDAFSALGEKFDELRDHTETTKAETEAIYADNDNEVKAMQDPDVYGALDKAKERMAATNDTLAQKFSSPDARNAFMEKRQLQGATEIVNLETKLRAKQINVAKATTFEHIDAQVKKFQDAVSPAERNQIASDMVGHIQKAIKKDYMTPEAGYEYLKSHIELMHLNQVTHDIDLAEGDPNGSQMIKNITTELTKGKNGQYPNLNTKQRDEMLAKANTMSKRIDPTGKARQGAIHTDTTNDLFTKFQNHELKQTELDDAFATGKLNKADGEQDRHFYETMSKALKSDKITGEKKSSGYKDVLKTMENPKTATIGNIRLKIAQHTADGTLSVDDAKQLGTLVNIPATEKGKPVLKSLDELMAKESADKKAHDERFSVINSVAGMFNSAFPLAKDTAINVMRKFTGNVTKNNLSPDQWHTAAKTAIKQQRLEDHPAMASLPEEGKRHVDAFGNVAVLHPDGEVVEEEQDTQEEEPEHDTEN
jgi:hypothetical protein